MANQIIRNWFDKLEESLQADAALASLMGHGTLIGDAREFFVRRVLKTVLPPAVHIGRGMVVGANGQVSNQIDVVIYDPLFPVLEIESGQGLYLNEGVIAAIEVKSTLNKGKLFEALDNCLSVSTLPSEHQTPKVEFNPSQIRMFSERTYQSSTYIFSFDSDTENFNTLGKRVLDWLGKKSLEATKTTLPRVTVAGSVIGITSDEHYVLGLNETDRQVAVEKYGAKVKMAAGFWHVKNRFGWLLTHLLQCCMQRNSIERKTAAEHHWPVREYWTEQLENKPSFRIFEH